MFAVVRMKYECIHLIKKNSATMWTIHQVAFSLIIQQWSFIAVVLKIPSICVISVQHV